MTYIKLTIKENLKINCSNINYLTEEQIIFTPYIIDIYLDSVSHRVQLIYLIKPCDLGCCHFCSLLQGLWHKGNCESCYSTPFDKHSVLSAVRYFSVNSKIFYFRVFPYDSNGSFYMLQLYLIWTVRDFQIC